MATATEVRQAQEEMLDAAARLVEDVDDAPAGVVLRSYWRAVHLLRHAGCPLPGMAAEADLVARGLLVARGVRVPRPRGTDRELVPLPRGA
jgi:hypothetical protein